MKKKYVFLHHGTKSFVGERRRDYFNILTGNAIIKLSVFLLCQVINLVHSPLPSQPPTKHVHTYVLRLMKCVFLKFSFVFASISLFWSEVDMLES